MFHFSCYFVLLPGIPPGYFRRQMQWQLSVHYLWGEGNRRGLFPILRPIQRHEQLTNSSSSGTRDNKSKTSLFGTVCGLSRRRENLMMPHSIRSTRMGTKCNTRQATNNNNAVSQLNSGTEKLKVLKLEEKKKWD